MIFIAFGDIVISREPVRLVSLVPQVASRRSLMETGAVFNYKSMGKRARDRVAGDCFLNSRV